MTEEREAELVNLATDLYNQKVEEMLKNKDPRLMNLIQKVKEAWGK